MKFILATNNNLRVSGKFTAVTNGTQAILTGNELCVYTTMLSMAGSNDGRMYASKETIARRSGVGLSTVKRAIPSLIEKGLINELVKGQYKGNASLYEVYRLVGEQVPQSTGKSFVFLDELDDEQRQAYFKMKAGMDYDRDLLPEDVEPE